VRAAPIGRPPFLLEDVRLGEHLQADARKPEPPRQDTRRDEHGPDLLHGRIDDERAGRTRLRKHRRRRYLVIGQQLNRPIRAAGRRGHEDHRARVLAGTANLRHPLRDAAPVLNRWLARHVAPSRRSALVVDSQLVEAYGPAEHPIQILPINQQRPRRQHGLGAADGILVARERTGNVPISLGTDVGSLGHEHEMAAQVVEDRRPRSAVPIDHVSQRDHLRVLDRTDRSLGRWIVAADRLDEVPNQFEPDRLRIPCREQIHHPTPHAELAVPVHGVLTSESCVDEQLGQAVRVNLAAGPEIDRDVKQAFRRTHTREQSRGRRDNDSGGTLCGRMERPCAGGGHLKVRRQAAIWVDLRRRERQHGPRDGLRHVPLERAEEKPDVARHLLDVGVSGNDHQDGGLATRSPGFPHRCRGNQERLRRSRETGDMAVGHSGPHSGHSRLEQGAERECAGNWHGRPA
jgi:hypothetical protein